MFKNDGGVNGSLRGISRVNLCIAVGALIFVAAVYAWLRWGDLTTQSTTTTHQSNNAASAHSSATIRQQTQEELQSAYQQELNTLLADVDFRDPATAAALQSRVEKMTVPTEYKMFHIQIVAALQDVETQQYESAHTRIKALREHYAWFLPE